MDKNMDVCTILAPMRNGTSVFMYSLFRNPEILGLTNFAESLRDMGQSKSGNGKGMIKNYVPTLKALAQTNEWRHRDFLHLNFLTVGGPKVIVDRNHIPFGEEFWRQLNGSGFKIISLIRDPREVALSASRWQEMERRNPNKTPKKQYIRGFMNLWHQSIKAYDALKVKNDAILIRYEDVCADPKGEARKVFEWLGVSTDDKYLQHFADSYREPVNRRATNPECVEYLTPQIKDAARKIGYKL